MLDEQILNTIKNSFASSTQAVNLPSSYGRFMYFREPCTREQKAIAKITLSNTDKQSVVYASTLSMIKLLAIDKTFDQYALNEFERLNVIAHLFSNNFFSKTLSINCPNKDCKHQFIFSVKHGDIIKKMNKVDQSDIVFENECQYGTIKIIAGYPSVRRYLNFLEKVDEYLENTKEKTSEKDRYNEMNDAFSELEKQIQSQQENSGKEGEGGSLTDIKIAEMIKRKKQRFADNQQNTETNKTSALGLLDNPISDTVDLYIKSITYRVNGSPDDIHIDFTNFEFDDMEKILGVFPVAFMVKENGQHFSDFISAELFKRQKVVVPEIICPKCGENISSHLTMTDFFTNG